jgi:hypothetical protein
VLFLTKDEFVHELGIAKEKLSFLMVNHARSWIYIVVGVKCTKVSSTK